MPRPGFPRRLPTPVTILAVALLTGSGFSCQGILGPDGPPDYDDLPADRVVVAFDFVTSGYPNDLWDLEEGAVVGDTLELTVSYGGGCRNHDFRLFAVDDWIPLHDQGMTPKIGVPLFLSHHAHGDNCEALITSTLRFGLGPLRDAYARDHGPGPANLLLQITDGRDGFAIHIFDFPVGQP